MKRSVHDPRARARRRPATTTSRALPALLALGLALGSSAGCGVLPEVPGEMPDTVVPSLVPEAPDSQGNLSTDGFDAAQQMAVRIRNVSCDQVVRGTGFAIDARTLITNKHVVDGNTEIQLSTYDGRDVDVTNSGTAALADLAIVRTAEDLDAYPELAADDPEPGDDVTVVGYPNGGQLTATKGSVIAYTSDPLNANLGQVLLTDAPVEPGSSGSAALDAQGRVIGVVYAKNGQGQSYVVPVSTLRGLLDDDAGFVAQVPPAC